ncbi:PREDICTED: transmembrane protein 11, mitochondrial-like [Priapulus caudatus]|uniref:Transmembrane protein 11, mitochondrial-like n=1 Tax=Priapulus caudatus TaxID=37621 RepID=A0ABM1EEU4_PRICU|nr:PREDICTED: transmembrane protein 11, mitochondrial-like [Priapulus caudatus]
MASEETSESDLEHFPKDWHIIHEIYSEDDVDLQESFEVELERALEAKCNIIVIEPPKLGDETAKWIKVGNCLHKTGVLAGLGSLVSAGIWQDQCFLSCPLAVISMACTGIYTVSWQFDPCCKYQVEHDPKRLSCLPLHTLSSSSPVVLVRRDDTRRKLLHSSVSALAGLVCTWRLGHCSWPFLQSASSPQ